MMPYALRPLLQRLEALAGQRTFLRFEDVAGSEPATLERAVLLRFDVERDVAHHVRIAERLTAMGIRATLFFHTRRETFDVAAMAAIRAAGHEIGFHHECLDRCGGDFERARELFRREVQLFADHGLPVRTVCSHGELGLPKPGYVANADLLRRYPELYGETGIDWEVYDNFESMHEQHYATDTLSGIRGFHARIDEAASEPRLLQILMHPHRWRDSRLRVAREVLGDLAQAGRNRVMGRRRYALVSEVQRVG